MSFDPFEARMQFLQLLRKLNASQLSIQKVVGYAIKYGSKCGEDLWECILEECAKGSLNTRINLLYLLDSLLEISLPLSLVDAPYPPLISENLQEIVKRVVPAGEGILNLKAAKQILESWRMRRLIDPEVVSDALKVLEVQGNQRVASGSSSGSGSSKRGRESFSRGDIVRRMEEDRERHKRLRERIWILPIPPLVPPSTNIPPRTASLSRNLIPSQSPNSSTSPYTPASPASGTGKVKSSVKPKTNTSMPPPPPPAPAAVATAPTGEVEGVPNPLDVEFDQLWETGSDLDPDDLDKMNQDSITLNQLET